ncbi:hypothetical protein LXA54_16955 [Erwinia amylovora]|uniref:hypothetical protein n=1 Tax=Erwinia amylovora TaxID=552 RepID=UPI0020BDBF36|nr:hypothetical protein [Erwinia amylovora]MCK8335979.1 hypothetical protein [Erwinia amylovora]
MERVKTALILFGAVTFASPALANSINTNLSTMQQLQSQQILRNGDDQALHNLNQGRSNGSRGSGYPIYDASAIEQAKMTLYNNWKEKHHSDMSYEEWSTTKFDEALNER